MHDDMGSVQQNGEKSIGVFSLAYQLLQAVNQSTYSVGINPLLLYIWTHSISVCSTKACEMLQLCPLVHIESHIAEFRFIPSGNISHQTGANSTPGPQLLVLQTGVTPRVIAKLKLMAVAGQNWYNVEIFLFIKAMAGIFLMLWC